MPDSYDEVKYPSYAVQESHPALVSALARIAGLEMPPVKGWRVLEIGCGTGANILPLAFDYPVGSFIGVDRALDPIRAGQALASRLQLKNIELRAADLRDWEPEGEFDYVIAHGVFSWVPPDLREKILQICSSTLKAHGIAFISYNTYPGCYLRRYAGDFLRFHTRDTENASVRMEKARDLARLILDKPEGADPLQRALRREMETILEKDPSVLYHDDLSGINEPFYLLDFVALAGRHGLQYLGDAEPQRDAVGDLPLQSKEWIESCQYGDFLAGRRFRETLLCRRSIALDRRLSLDRFRDLFAASRAKPSEPGKDGEQQFELPRARSIATNNPFIRQTLCRLSSLWPESIRVSALAFEGFTEEETAETLMQLTRIDAIELRTHPPAIASRIEDRPRASALARAQVAEGGRRITNQRHGTVEIGDDIGFRVLSLLDGNRDRQQLVENLAAVGLDRNAVVRNLESGLAALHRLCLLT